MNAAHPSPEAELVPLRWSTERYLTLVESGVIEEGRGVELIDGQIVVAMPQGKIHNLLFLALQRVFRTMEMGDLQLAVQTTVILPGDNTFDPKFTLLRKEYDIRELPTEEDVLWTIEVSVSSRRIDLGVKKAAYAAAGIPVYWVVDAVRRGIWTFERPEDGGYAEEAFVPAGETILVPVLGTTLDTGAIFSP